ncbi:daunorubicin C-13 ketoreductase [Halobacteriales archaeon SW_7_68_16]|nr:MAG: daunorubicin C-13 ketoreductase [Halobacteriales archaeon SW_7_68_16]
MGRPPEEVAGVADVDCTGMETVVTGSTSGIGRETALALGRLGADVIVHGRDEGAGEAVVEEIRSSGADARFVRADFADVDSVRDLAATVRSETDGLDRLFNNAGGLFRGSRRTDLDVEFTFHVNHLAPYLLTADLLDHLDDDARVVTTASDAHRGTSLDIDRTTDTDASGGMWAYSHSKLANVLFASELARRFEGSGHDGASVSVHPGAIPGSGFTRFLPGPLDRATRALEVLPGITSVADGAAALLFAGLSPRTDDLSGRYFAGQQPRAPSTAARNEDDARLLWERSAALLGIDEPLATAATVPADD